MNLEIHRRLIGYTKKIQQEAGSQNVLPCWPWTPGRPRPTPGRPGSPNHWNVKKLVCLNYVDLRLLEGLHQEDQVVPIIEMSGGQNVLPCGPWTPGRPTPGGPGGPIGPVKPALQGQVQVCCWLSCWGFCPMMEVVRAEIIIMSSDVTCKIVILNSIWSPSL